MAVAVGPAGGKEGAPRHAGELLIRSAMVMREYWNKPKKSVQDSLDV